MAHFDEKKLVAASGVILEKGVESYPDFGVAYERHIAQVADLEAFKLGFSVGYEVAKAENKG